MVIDCAPIFPCDRACHAAVKIIFGIPCLWLFHVSECSIRGLRCAKAHPILSPTHRQIFITGEISVGTDAEGLTKEQGRLAAGNPTRLRNSTVRMFGAMSRKRASPLPVSFPQDSANSRGSSPHCQRNCSRARCVKQPPITVVPVRFVVMASCELRISRCGTTGVHRCPNPL